MEGAGASADEDALRAYLEEHPMPQRRSEEEGDPEANGIVRPPASDECVCVVQAGWCRSHTAAAAGYACHGETMWVLLHDDVPRVAESTIELAEATSHRRVAVTFRHGA